MDPHLDFEAAAAKREGSAGAADGTALDPAATAEARALLTAPARRERLWPVVLAAACLAAASLAFAAAMILAPPVVKEHTVRTAPGS